MQLKQIFLILSVGLLLAACGPAETPSETSSDTPSTTKSEPAKTYSEGMTTETTPAPDPSAPAPVAKVPAVYTWVSTLNVRDQPATSGKIIAAVTPDQALQPTGKKSDKPEAIALRGRTFNENWLEVTTPDGKTGWVFGGAIQPAGHGTKTIVQALDNFRCNQLMAGDGGCGCDFSTTIKGAKEGVFFSLIETNEACLTLDGTSNALKGYVYDYSYLDAKRPWIILTDKKNTLFGEDAPFGEYEEMVRRLTDALLSFDKIPSEIPIENKMTAGMFVREVRDMASDAITAAKKRRAAGERNGDFRMHFSNERYQVIITGNMIEEMHEGSEYTKYEALLQVEDAKGKVLERVPVTGGCGC